MSQTAIQRLQAADATLAGLDPVPFHLPVAGLEAVIVGALAGLSDTDWWVPGLRERVGAVLRKVAVERLANAHQAGFKPYHIAPPSPAPALRALYAVGLALASPNRVTLVHLGVGSTADGAFAEALNLAALRKAPVLFLVAVFPLTEDAPLGPQVATAPAALANAYGIPSHTVDGQSAKAVAGAVRQASANGGPHLIQALLAPGEPVHPS